MTARPLRAAVLALLLASGGGAAAQDLDPFGAPGEKVTLGDVTVEPEVAAGGEAHIRSPVAIVPDWPIYGLTQNETPTTVTVPAWPAGLSRAGLSEEPLAHPWESGGVVQMVHEDEVVFVLRVAVARDAEPGPRTVTGTLGYMACDESTCDPAATLPFSATFEVTPYEGPHAWLGPVSAAPARVEQGGSGVVRLPVELFPGWHVYGLADSPQTATRVEIGEWPAGLAGGAPSESPAPKEVDYWGVTALFHEGEVTFTVPFDVAPDAALGERTVRGRIVWLACDDSVCEPATTTAFEVRLDVVAAGSGGPSVSAPPAPPAAGADDYSGGVTLALILQAIALGFIPVGAPCVCPLRPITVSFFSKQEGPALPRSLVYGAGWIFTIVGIGLVFKSTLDVFARGDLFNAAVGLLFLVLALSLFGLFDLRLPGFLSDWSTAKSAAGGYVGAFFMAVTIALTSFSCSVPFLAIMFERFEAGEFGVALVGLTVYAGTLAAPFVLCSLFPALLGSMPRAGAWMNAVKVTMGFVELALAFKFLRTVDLNNDWGFLPRELVLAIWVACSLGAGLYLLGYIVLPHDTKVESIGVVRLLFAVLFLSLTVYLVPGVFKMPLSPQIEAFIQTTEEELTGGIGSRTAGEEAHIPWVRDDWDGALERAQAAGRPVLFDFTGVG